MFLNEYGWAIKFWLKRRYSLQLISKTMQEDKASQVLSEKQTKVADIYYHGQYLGFIQYTETSVIIAYLNGSVDSLLSDPTLGEAIHKLKKSYEQDLVEMSK